MDKLRSQIAELIKIAVTEFVVNISSFNIAKFLKAHAESFDIHVSRLKGTKNTNYWRAHRLLCARRERPCE